MGSEPYGFLGEQESTEDKAAALRRAPLFEGLDDNYLYGIARHSTQVQAEPDQVLIREGESGREFMMILTGGVRIERDGNVVAHMKAGDCFGEMTLIDGRPRSATVVADAPSTLLVLDSSVFAGLLDSDPRLTRKLLVTAVGRLRERGEDPLDV
jgi:CRP/FNR family transcriptional regulator, cyclic AMP receptor protein